MVFSSTQFYIVVLVSISFGLIIIALVIRYLMMVNRYVKLREELAKRKQGVDDEYQKIISQAELEGRNLLEKARANAEEVIKSAQIFNNNQQNLLLQQIDLVNKKHLSIYQGALEKIQNDSLLILQNIPKDVRSGVSQELVSFRSDLQVEVAKIQQEARSSIAETYKKIEVEINAYKESRIKKLDSQIVEIVTQISKDVLGKVISTEEHEKLVLKALEEAKRQNVF